MTRCTLTFTLPLGCHMTSLEDRLLFDYLTSHDILLEVFFLFCILMLSSRLHVNTSGSLSVLFETIVWENQNVLYQFFGRKVFCVFLIHVPDFSRQWSDSPHTHRLLFHSVGVSGLTLSRPGLIAIGLLCHI